MMKRISLLILLAGLSYGQVTNVIATKSVDPFWVVPSATMPLNLWTNSVLWITAESPVLNAGTTNANWVCYARFCGGNASNRVIANQPVRITTNGAPYLQFNGATSTLQLPLSNNFTNSFTLSVKFSATNYTGTKILLNKWNGVESQYILYSSANRAGVGICGTNATQYLLTLSDFTLTNGSIYTLTATYDGTTLLAYLNGVQSTNRVAYSGKLNAPTTIPNVGFTAGSPYFDGRVYSVYTSSNAVSSNLVAELFK
jgi:hypothetical protein